MKYYFATHLNLEGVCCAALLLRKYEEYEVEIDFLTIEEAMATDKMYDLACGLPKPKNAKILINGLQKATWIITLNNLKDADKVKGSSTASILREYLALEDEVSKEIVEYSMQENVEKYPIYQEFDLMIRYMCGSQYHLFSLARKWALLGNELFSEDCYLKTVREMKNEKEAACRKLKQYVQYNIKHDSQTVILNTLGSISYAFAEMAFDYLFDQGVKVAGIIYRGPRNETSYVEVSIRVNPIFAGKCNVLPIAEALRGVGNEDFIHAKAHSVDHVISIIAQKLGPLNSFCYLYLKEEKSINSFPYDKMVCIEASMKELSSKELKTMIFPNLEIAVSTIFETSGIEECVIIQKCNCVEIYIVHNLLDSDEVIKIVKEKWEQLIGYNIKSEIWEKVKIHYGKETIYHLYRVASSLESLIIGDNLVFSQVISSYNVAVKQGTVKDVFAHVFKQLSIVTKKIRTSTKLYGHGLSLGRVAVALLLTEFSNPFDTVTVVGSGQISEIVVNSIQNKWKSTRINIVTHRVDYISNKYTNPLIEGHNYNDIVNCAKESDAVIFCTYSKKPIISTQELQKIIEHGRLKILIDMGMPPNVETVDSMSIPTYSLAKVVEFGKIQFQQRVEEAKVTEDIIKQAYNEFENTTIEYKKNKILRKLAPDIHRAVGRNNIESALIGILIQIFDNLNPEELNAIESAIDKISKQ